MREPLKNRIASGILFLIAVAAVIVSLLIEHHVIPGH